MKKISLFLVTLFLIFTSCTSNKIEHTTNPVYVTNAKTVYILPPENMAGQVDSLQLLNGHFGDTGFTLFVYFQADQSGIYMSLLNDFGTDMGTLSYDGNQVIFDSAVFPSNLKAEYILLDIQNAYYSVDALEELYTKAGLTFIENESYQEEAGIVKIRQVKSGSKLVEQITIYEKSIKIQNILRGYEYNLTEGEE